jgi:outer membrane protein assembly factor BamB
MAKENRICPRWAICSIALICLIGARAGAQTTQPQISPPTTRPLSPDVLPGNGLAQHPFLYAGEWDTRHPEAQSMFLVQGGKIVWQYSIPMKAERGGIQEFDDATLLPDGNIVFSRMSGAGIVSPDKKLVWDYQAPVGTEVHSAQYIGNDRVLIMRNGTPAQAMIINTATNVVEKIIPIPTTTKAIHGQFRHIRMTPAGTILVGHIGEGKVVEYDLNGNVVWSVKAENAWQCLRLDNGNTLITGDARHYVREINPKGEIVWEFTQADVPDIKLFNIQGAERLANGNTVFCNWCPNGLKDAKLWPQTVQVLEVSPDKKLVWALRSWDAPADLGTATSIQLLDEPGAPAMHLPAQ